MRNRLKSLVRGFRDLQPFDNTAQLFLDRLLFRKQGLVVYRLNGMKILIDHDGGDENGTRDVLVNGMYSEFLSNIPRDKPLNVLDNGANGGGFPLSMQLLGFRFETLVCVEMNPATFGRLSFNVAQNIQCRQHLINAALYSSNGSLPVTLGEGSTSDSIHEPGDGRKDTRTVTIPTRTFDSIAQECFSDEPIDVCKIDIEGAEFDVLFSDSATSLRRVRYLIIEIHPNKDKSRQDLLILLSGLGFIEAALVHKTSETCSLHFLRNTALDS